MHFDQDFVTGLVMIILIGLSWLMPSQGGWRNWGLWVLQLFIAVVLFLGIGPIAAVMLVIADIVIVILDIRRSPKRNSMNGEPSNSIGSLGKSHVVGVA